MSSDNTEYIARVSKGKDSLKTTLLWLKGLPALKATNVLTEHSPYLPSNTGAFSRGGGSSRGVAHDAVTASKTFPGVAKAMAEQWGGLCDGA